MAQPKQPTDKEDEAKLTPDFVEIGGSPVPGLTLRHVLRGHTDAINRIAWSPDGKYLASPSNDKTIRIWDVSTGECVRVLEGHTNQVTGVAWSPDGHKLLAGTNNNVWLWDTKTATYVQKFDNYRNHVAWSPKGERIALYKENNAEHGKSGYGEIVLLDGHDYKILKTLKTKWGVHDFVWSPDSSMILAGGYNTEFVFIWKLDSSETVYFLPPHNNQVNTVAWSPDGLRIGSGSTDKTIRIWDVTSQKLETTIEASSEFIITITFSEDGRLLAFNSYDNTVKIIDSKSWKTKASIDEQQNGRSIFRGIAFGKNINMLSTFCMQQTAIRIWEIDHDKLLGNTPNIESIHYTTAKLVLVGDSGVGKTGLGWRLAHGEFKEHASTHGQQFWSIPQLGLKRKDGTDCEAVLWDLAGQHVYRQVHSIFLDNVSAALVLFDPTNRQEPLKGAQFWLEQLKGKGNLPPTVLVGARVDRGAPALSQAELDQFCQRYGISGGYISTSALKGDGLAELLDLLKKQIPWDDMTATVTTTTFKRIKDYVLSLKEKTDRKGVLVSPQELRKQLETVGTSLADVQDDRKGHPYEPWEFTDAEMMTAVGHLETNGIVTILKSSSGENHILLAPELLVNIAASIMLLADKNARELGAVSETELLGGKIEFDELKGLDKKEQQILVDSAIQRFLEHNICFRDTFGSDTLLIFPSLIKQKRPLQDDLPATDDMSYVVRGRVENLYASLVVLLGYTPTFSRINQWQNQAQYEMEPSQVCGFRSVEEREGELELVLYYGDALPSKGREKFQELFEQFLYQRDVDVARFPPVTCKNHHRIERATVVKRVREGKDFVFCDECGDKTFLPDFDKPQTIGIGASPWLQREEAMARLRSAYEKHLTNIKSYRRGWAMPRAYLSRLPAQDEWAEKLSHDLRDAGVYILEKAEELKAEDYAILLDTPAYRQAFQTAGSALANDAKIIRVRLSGSNKKVLALACEGTHGEHELRQCKPGDFCDETHYAVSLFDLVLNLYAIPLTHAGFVPLRAALHGQWEQTLAKYPGAPIVGTPEPPKDEPAMMDYQDFQVLITPDRKIRASSSQGDEWDDLRLDFGKIKLALTLVEKRQTDDDLLKGLGRELYQALFPNKINARWHATRASAEAAGCGVRLRITCEPPDLAALPWEFLYDEGTNTFLTNDTQTAVSRYLDVPQGKRPVGGGHPLKILLVISSPTDLRRLDAAGEEALIRAALAAHLDAGLVELDVVREATIRNLTQQLRLKPYNVLHFIGHGDFENEKGLVALVEPDGKKRLLDEEAFANLFLGNRSLGLVVLNSCQGASSSSYKAMTGVAPRLVQRGLPAVVAMQYPILDTTAKQFADEFYRTLALGWPVDAAMQTTRNAISIETGTGKPDFATPVLYMRAKDGVIMSGG